MAPASPIDRDPFADPIASMEQSRDAHSVNPTLVVGRNASLTLATDSLIIIDEAFSRRETLNCCGLIPINSKPTRAIPFYNILWAELSELDITIHYAQQSSKIAVRVASVDYQVEKSNREFGAAWVSQLLNYAYGESQRRKRIKVLINPVGGKGRAQKWYTEDIEPILVAAKCEIDVERTQFQGHATEISEKLDIEAYDVIAACSGDGLPFEIFNGLGKKQNARRALSKMAVVQLPCGSGNALSLNLNGTNSNSLAALAVVKGIRTPVDLISITQGDQRVLSFLSQSFGVIAETDLDTDHLRWMGSARFTWGFLVRLLTKKNYPCDIAVKVDIGTKPEIRDHYRNEINNLPPPNGSHRDSEPGRLSSSDEDGLPPLKYGTINDPLSPSWTFLPTPNLSNFWCGNMPLMAPDTTVFPAALPQDGFADLVTIDSDISRVASIRSMLAAATDNKFFDMDHVCYRKVSAYRLIPKSRDGDKKSGGSSGGVHFVSIDGERFPGQPWQAEVHRGLGMVLSRRGGRYESKGVA